MNVLQVMGCTSDQYASMERYLVGKARVLKESGHNLYVIYENVPKSKQFVEDIFRLGGKIYSIKQGSFYDLHFYKGLRKILKEKDIDLVHTYFTPTCHYVNIILAIQGFKKVVRTGANLPLSIKGNGTNASPFYMSILSARHKILSIFVRKILCRSLGVMNEYESLGVSPNKLVVTSGGVDVAKYNFALNDRLLMRKDFNIENTTLVLGVFCRLVATKKIDKLIESVRDFRITDRKIKLLIAGDGPESFYLKKLVNDMNLNNKIIILGHRNDIHRLYSAIDVFCLPSIAEGMSNSLLEAMSSELPILANNISSNRELIDDGRGGYLISFESKDEFQDRIEQLLDSRIRKKMGSFNRKKVVAQYSLNARIEKEIQIYHELNS